MKVKIKEYIDEKKERAERSLADIKTIKGGHSSYGAGVEDGILEVCREIEKILNGQDPFED